MRSFYKASLALGLAFLAGSAWGSASLTIGTISVSTDGFHLTVPISGVSGSLSPTSGITGFIFGATQNGSFRGIGSTVTASGNIVSFALNEPVMQGGDDAGQLSLATVGGGSNLTDTGGNTPSSSGNTNVGVAYDSSTWFAIGGSSFTSFTQLDNGVNVGGGPLVYQQNLSCNGFDCKARFIANITGINIFAFNFGNHWVLLQDSATTAGDFGDQSSATVYSTFTAISGLSGTHLYEIDNIGGGGLNAFPNPGTYILTRVQLIGLSSPLKPASVPVVAECGDSLVALGGAQAPSDSRVGHLWLSSYHYGISDIGTGYSGYTVYQQLDSLCPEFMTGYGKAAALLYLEGGNNDSAESVSTTNYVAAWDTYITGVQANTPTAQHIVVEGILPSSSISSSTLASYTAYNQSEAVKYGLCYMDRSNWVGANQDRQSDNIHLNNAGEILVANQYMPVTAGYVLGQSYSATGPSSGLSGIASSNFTVQLASGATFTGVTTTTDTITLNDGGAGGTFTTSLGTSGLGPLTSTPTAATSSFTFTYTPSSNGTKTITLTNGQMCWTNPSSLTYTVGGTCGGTAQSIVLSTQSVTNGLVPAITVNKPYTVEFSMANVDSSIPNNTIISGSAVGFTATLLNLGSGDIRINMNDTNDNGANFPFQLSIGTFSSNGGPYLPSNFFTVRFTHDTTGQVDTYSMWDANGNIFASGSYVWTLDSGSNSNGATIASAGNGYSMSYFRIYTSTLNSAGSPPTNTHSESGCLLDWNFEGNLNDSCSVGPYNGTISAGTPYYVTTPNQSLFYPQITSGLIANSPQWVREWPSQGISMRAGYPGVLDANATYTQNLTTGTVTYQWAELSGPSTLKWDSNYIATPTVSGLTYGDYQFQLTATNMCGSSSTVIDIGSVATDTNSVVISSNPNVDLIFGPQLMFGKNPWQYADERQWSGSNLNNYGSPKQYWTWLTLGQSTVSWTWGGVGNGFGFGAPGSTTTVTISSFTLSIPIGNKTLFDFTEFPTRFIIFGNSGNEEVRVCSKTDGTGNVTTLNVCYDGRASGYGSNLALATSLTPLAANAGAIVGQHKILGSNTLFLTDPNTALCPDGADTPAGTINSTGSVTVTAGTSTITGIGTNWTSALVGLNIVVDSSHTATAFNFIGNVSVVNSPTSITLNRVYPLDATTGNYKFQLINTNRIIDLQYTRTTDGSIGQRMWGTTGCESQIGVYGMAENDVPTYDGLPQTGHWSYKAGVGNQSFFGQNFYGSGLAHRSLALRSGLNYAMAQANTMDDYWCADPEEDGQGSGDPLAYGGGFWGCMIDLATNPNTQGSWSNVRPAATQGLGWATSGCNFDDSRDTGYEEGIVSLAYLFDSSATYKPTWAGGIASMLFRDTATVDGITGDTGCVHNDGSFANGEIFNNISGFNMDVTNGTSTVMAHSGTTFNSATCYDVAHGTMTVTKGSSHITGGGFVNTSNQITLTGTMNSQVLSQWTPFSYISSTAANIGENWPGDSSTGTYILINSAVTPTMLTIAASNNDPRLRQNWSCYYDGPSSVTLQSPWTSATDTTGDLYSYPQIISGYGQQPYMLGINMRHFDWLTHASTATYQAAFNTLISTTSNWEYNVGFSTDVLAINYGRVYQGCEPAVSTGTNLGLYRNGGYCQPGSPDLQRLPPNRQLNTEGMTALKDYYEQQGKSAASKAWADSLYGGVFGYCPWTASGLQCDQYYAGPTSNLTNVYLAAYKYFGQAFGVGFSSTWAAERTGGVAPSVPRTLFVGYTLPANATKAQILLTEPDGYIVTNTCTVNVCPVTGDARQGVHLMQIQYLNSGGAVVAQTDQTPQPVQ